MALGTVCVPLASLDVGSSLRYSGSLWLAVASIHAWVLLLMIHLPVAPGPLNTGSIQQLVPTGGFLTASADHGG